MAARKANNKLIARLNALQEERGGGFNIDAVALIVEEAVASALNKMSKSEIGLRSELEQLSDIIRSAKAEIALLAPQDVKSEYLPTAADELDAVVEATEVATNDIMSATEQIDVIAGELGGDIENNIADLTIQIYTACGFQDITGQRITKVVSALKSIETRVDDLISALESGGKKGLKKKAPKKKAATRKGDFDDELLEGPQLKGKAIKQEDIDALLADFD